VLVWALRVLAACWVARGSGRAERDQRGRPGGLIYAPLTRRTGEMCRPGTQGPPPGPWLGRGPAGEPPRYRGLSSVTSLIGLFELSPPTRYAEFPVAAAAALVTPDGRSPASVTVLVDGSNL